MAKLNNNITIALDDETAAMIQKMATFYQRKPAELVRLVLLPALLKEWIKLQELEHPENNTAPTLARFPL